MRKVILGLVIILLSGCKSSNLDLNKISNEITKLDEFKNFKQENLTLLSNRYGLDNCSKDNLVIASSSYDNASMVVIADQKCENLVSQIKQNYENQWVKFDYFPKEKEKVESATYEKYGNYILYVVSSDKSDILKIIKG